MRKNLKKADECCNYRLYYHFYALYFLTVFKRYCNCLSYHSMSLEFVATCLSDLVEFQTWEVAQDEKHQQAKAAERKVQGY